MNTHDLSYEQLLDNLSTLGLTHMATIMDNYLERALKEEKSIIQVLQELTEKEVQFKRNRASEIQVKVAGFPYIKTLEEFDFEFQPSIDRKTIDELRSLKFIHNAENVVLLGPPGVGKTHLAVALGIIAARNRYSTYYISCHDLIQQLNKAHFENVLDRKIKNFSKYKVLIIDEIGYLPLDRQGANLLFQLIAKRYEKSTTILTSNKPFSQWGEVFSDNTIAAAILDRLLHHSTVINIRGESYRLKERKQYLSGKKEVINSLLENHK